MLFSDLFDDFDQYYYQVPMRRQRKSDVHPSYSRMVVDPNPFNDIHGWVDIIRPQTRPKRATCPHNAEDLLSQLLPNWSKDTEEGRKLNEVVLNKAGVSLDDWSYVIDQPLSEFRPEDIEISLEGGELKVSGHRNWQNQDGSQKMSRSFSQSITVPSDVKMGTLQSKVIVGHNSKPQIVIHAERENQKKVEKQKTKIPVEIVFDPGMEKQQVVQSDGSSQTANSEGGNTPAVGDWPNKPTN